MLGEEGGKDASGVHEHGDDVFLKKIESHLLTQASCGSFSLPWPAALTVCLFVFVPWAAHSPMPGYQQCQD